MPGTNLGTAYVQIVPSAQGISGAIRKSIGGEADAAGKDAGNSIAGKIKGAIAAAGIGVAVGAGLKKSLLEGADLQQAIGGIETLFGAGGRSLEQFAADTGRTVEAARGEYNKLMQSQNQMISNADNAYKTAGISANAYMEQATSFAASLLQSVDGDTQKAASAADKAVIAMADNANKMGSNMEDIQNAYQGFAKQNYTMLDNLKLGYGGTKTEMERLLADAEKIHQETTGEATNYDINNLADVYAAIQDVQTELGITGTTSQEAASTFSGSFAAMKAASDNLFADLMLGRNLGPAMQGLVDTATTFLFNNLFPAVGNIIQSLPTAIGTFIQTGLPLFMAEGTKIVTSLAAGAKTALPGMIQNLMTGLVTLSGNLRAGFSKFVDIGLGLIKSIALGIIQNIPTFIQTVPQIITNIAGMINDNAPKLLTTGLTIIKALGKGLINAIPVLLQNLPQIITAIFSLFQAIQWANLGKLAVTGISKGIKAMAGKVKSSAKEIGDKITAPIKAVPGKITGAISSIRSKLSFSGLASKVSSAFKSIKEKITKPIDEARDKVKGIIKKIEDFFPLSAGKIFSGLSLPHFSVSGGKFPFGVAGKGSLPKWSVSWYRKAEETPYMFNKATFFGAGEAGDEVLYGRRRLMGDISEAVRNNSSGGGDIIINLNYTASDDADAMLRDLTRGVKRYRMAGVI